MRHVCLILEKYLTSEHLHCLRKSFIYTMIDIVYVDNKCRNKLFANWLSLILSIEVKLNLCMSVHIYRYPIRNIWIQNRFKTFVFIKTVIIRNVRIKIWICCGFVQTLQFSVSMVKELKSNWKCSLITLVNSALTSPFLKNANKIFYYVFELKSAFNLVEGIYPKREFWTDSGHVLWELSRSWSLKKYMSISYIGTRTGRISRKDILDRCKNLRWFSSIRQFLGNCKMSTIGNLI